MNPRAVYADILLAQKLLIDIHQLNPELEIASKLRELEAVLEDIHHQVLSEESARALEKPTQAFLESLVARQTFDDK